MNDIYVTIQPTGEFVGCIPDLMQNESKVTTINFIIPDALHGYNHRIEFKKPNYDKYCSSFLTETTINGKYCVSLQITNGITDQKGKYLLEYVATQNDNVIFRSKCGNFIVNESINAATQYTDSPDIINQLQEEIDTLETNTNNLENEVNADISSFETIAIMAGDQLPRGSYGPLTRDELIEQCLLGFTTLFDAIEAKKRIISIFEDSGGGNGYGLLILVNYTTSTTYNEYVYQYMNCSFITTIYIMQNINTGLFEYYTTTGA